MSAVTSSNRHLHHLPPVMELTPPTPPPSEAGMFEKDDLEFRTITTLLNILGTRERITLDNFQVSSDQRPRLKLLAALSSLLVRDHEIVAVMPKRSGRGSTLFVGAAAETPSEAAFRDDEPTPSLESSASSASSTSSHHNYITRNPRYKDPVGPVELLKNPTVEVGADIFEFIEQNWDQSFEHHVQSIAYLLNEALADPDNDDARVSLDMYSLFQSAPKINRRVNRSLRLEALLDLQPRFKNAEVPSPADQDKIRGVLTTNERGPILHTVLNGFLDHPPIDPRRWLVEFHRFFTWFLEIIAAEVAKLNKLRASKVPAPLPGSFIDHVFNNLGVLQYFSWKSSFFKSYVHEAFATGIMDPEEDATEVVTQESPSQLAEPVHPGRQQEHEEDSETNEEEEDMGLDISTEFETGDERASEAKTSESIDPFILELRLISSNIQHLDMLLSQAPRTRFRFHVIQYAPSGKSLKPWREVIQELFPKPELAKDIFQALEDMEGDQFACFRPGGRVLTFKGQAHCEAVLGCLFSITKRDEDNAWTGIPKAILRAISNCYSILAPSKRCCPVCATIISFLSEEAVEAGGTGLHALSKHSMTFPCALPVGLPSSIRQRLLKKYRHELHGRLIAMLDKKRSLSTGSGQSATLSDDGDVQIKPTSEQKRSLRLYKNGWGGLDEVARKERWEGARKGLTAVQLRTWWAEMNEDMKVGLLPPVPVEKPVTMPEMADLALVSEAEAEA